MTLYINTINREKIEIALLDENEKEVFKLETPIVKFRGEDVLLLIDKILKKKKIKIGELKRIIVENNGGTFSSVRSGVLIANSLGYALGIPVLGGKQAKKQNKKLKFNIVQPVYEKGPNITVKKKI